MKNPAEPFLIKAIWEKRVEYAEKEILSYYKKENEEQKKKVHDRAGKKIGCSGPFWERVWNLDCRYALETLSGSRYVGEEVYGFTHNATGTVNISVNGKTTSCWIDNSGRIGSADGGGPTIAQWLNWYQKDYSKVIAIIKEVFPECIESKSKSPL